jgi:hypothetical protein
MNGPRRCRRVTALLAALVAGVSTMAACAHAAGEPIVESPPPVPAGPPAVRPEPTPPPDGNGHPVIVHDCDTAAGYSVASWLPDAPPDGERETHLIAVYETSSDHGYGYHPIGAADVYVHQVSRPLVLAFSSYEPVRWRVHADAGVRIDRVVLYGYHPQRVTGLPGSVPVVDRSGAGRPRPDHQGGPAPDHVTADAGAPVGSVTGCYHAALFTLR